MKNNTLNYVILVIAIILVFAGVFVLTNKNIKKIIQLADIYKNGNHLVIFQNNAEIRPTGGFIGSYATIKTKNYKILDYDIQTNIYKIDDIFSLENKFEIKDDALAELLPDGNLAMRDSNWEPDYFSAAKNISWFYTSETENSVNSVTAINAEFVRKLIEITGPIPMVKYDMVIDENNFYENLHQIIDEDYHKDESNEGINEPKFILAEITPILTARIKKADNLFKVVKLVFESLENKDIQIASFDKKQQQNIIENNWDGKIIQSDDDYIHINHANIGADKTSIYINENIAYNINTEDSQYFNSELIIKSSIDKKYYDPGNKIFNRVYIPENSENIKIYENQKNITEIINAVNEYGYKCVRYYISLDGENEKNITITYQQPKINLSEYKLNIQKQSGALNQSLVVKIDDNKIYEGLFDRDLYLTY